MGSAPVEGDRANPARALAGRIPLTLGFLPAEGLLRLFAPAETTEVKCEGDVQAGGTIARGDGHQEIL